MRKSRRVTVTAKAFIFNFGFKTYTNTKTNLLNEPKNKFRFKERKPYFCKVLLNNPSAIKSELSTFMYMKAIRATNNFSIAV